MCRPDILCRASELSVRYPGAARDAVRDITLDLRQGERLALFGPSGSGKSTLALALLGAIPDLVPAERRGQVRWAGLPAGHRALVAGTGKAAAVLQDTDAQLVALTVEDEIAFALENRGLAAAAIDARIDEALARPPIEGLGRRDRTLALSGGWRQRLALGAALAEQPEVLVLDEPFAHLAEGAAQGAVAAIEQACRAGSAAILVEHRADHAAALADRALILDENGDAVAYGHPAPVLMQLAARPRPSGLRLPAAVRVAAALKGAGLLPGEMTGVGSADLLRALERSPRHARILPLALQALGFEGMDQAAPAPGRALVVVDRVTLERGHKPVLHDCSLTLHEGEIVGLAGPNGAGKTSLGLMVAGALRPRRGRLHRGEGEAPVYVPQNPALAFAAPSLQAEAARRGLPWGLVAAELSGLGIAPDGARHPLSFSHGEMRRIAIALTLALPGARLIVLDEPCAGLDDAGLQALTVAIGRLRRRGCGFLVVAHDLDWLASVADRIVVLAEGRVHTDAAATLVLRQCLDGCLPVAASPGAMLAASLGWRPGSASRSC